MKENVKDLLVRMLLKKAKGFSSKEQTDEFVFDGDGNKKLVKRRVVTKKSAPDVAACKALLEMNLNDLDLTDMTDEQLLAERDRLLNLLAACAPDNADPC